MNLARDCDVAAALRAGAPKARGLFVVSPVTADIDGSRPTDRRAQVDPSGFLQGFILDWEGKLQNSRFV